MAVDPYVPTTRDARNRPATAMPPARPWRAERPGDLSAYHPEGGLFGYQGPDQGYALRLAKRFRDQVTLAPSERWDDAELGAMLVACRRASLFGRAPVGDDLEIGFLVWGFLADGLPAHVVEELRSHRAVLFPHLAHHSGNQSRVAGAVPKEVLRQRPAGVRARLAAGERLIADVEAAH